MASVTPNASCLGGQLGPSAVLDAQSGADFARSGRLQAPALGTEVSFQRTPNHHPEKGFVRSRQFGTGIIEIVDGDAKPLRLTPKQYEVVK